MTAPLAAVLLLALAASGRAGTAQAPRRAGRSAPSAIQRVSGGLLDAGLGLSVPLDLQAETARRLLAAPADRGALVDRAERLVLLRDYLAPHLTAAQRAEVSREADALIPDLPVAAKRRVGRLMMEIAERLGDRPGAAEAGPMESAVRADLAERDLIRLVVTPAAGNGHQSTAGIVERRLRDLGFRGYLDVSVVDAARDESGERLTAGKLSRMFPHLAGRLRRGVSGLVDLAILGADDSAGLTSSELAARVAVSIQPYLWEGFRGAHQWTAGRMPPRLLPSGKGEDPAPIPGLEKRNPFHFRVHGAQEAAAALAAMRRDKADRGRADALSAALGRTDAELLPVYGVPWTSRFRATRGRDELAGPLLGLLGGVAHALRAEGGLKGPVLMPVFTPMDDAPLRAYFDSQLRHNPYLAANLTVVRADQPGAAEAVRTAAPGKIVLLLSGPVPQPVFEHVYSRATLAPSVAGVNAQNLMALLGRPYLPSVFADVPWDQDPGLIASLQAAGAERLVREATFAMRGPFEDEPEPSQDAAIGRFLLASRDPDSPLSRAFAARRPADAEGDRVVIALHAALRALGAVN